MSVMYTLLSTHPPSNKPEIIRRIQECKTYREWLAVMKSLPANYESGGYDIVKALDDNRRWSGERPLLPDESNQP